jgi:hypothetical protein
MPSVRFKETLQKLSATHRKRVEAELSLWKTEGMINGIDCAQLAENVESESALSIKAFSKLLKSFADQLENNTGDLNIWRSLCFGLELHGPKVPPSVRPRLLGRAGKLKDYADHLGKNVPMKTAFHLLTKNAGKTTPLGALDRLPKVRS